MSDLDADRRWREQDARQTYLKQREHLRDQGADQQSAFDKAISFIASGALAYRPCS